MKALHMELACSATSSAIRALGASIRPHASAGGPWGVVLMTQRSEEAALQVGDG
jgi:hypothetical protein